MENTGKYRDTSVDVMKGILVLQMVLCHCIQFFGKESEPVQGLLCDYINLTTFSGFLFAFGMSCGYAYFGKSFREAAPRMARTALKCLAAFYLSSICYLGLVQCSHYDKKVFGRVLTLQTYAGWSEFLASFFGVMLVGLLLFGLFRRMNGYLLAGICAVSALLTFVPYGQIHHPWAALFIGSNDYVTFPVIQYLFYFAAGVYCCGMWKKKETCADGRFRMPWVLACAAVLLSVPELAHYVTNNELSMRFPPDWKYVFGGCAVVLLYHLLSRTLCKNTLCAVAKIRGILSEIGANAIFYLLFSNLVIFAFAGSSFKLKNAAFAAKFYVVLLLSAWFVHHLIRADHRRR